MKDKTFAEVYSKDFLEDWTKMSAIRKPIIAAVSGYALGGGCELALMYVLASLEIPPWCVLNVFTGATSFSRRRLQGLVCLRLP